MRLSAKFIIIYCIFAALLAAPAVAQSSLTNTVDSLNRLASLCYKRHDYSQAGEYGRQAMNICRKAGDMEGYAKHAHSVGQCYNQAGLYFEALENYLIALHCQKEQGNFKAAFAVYNSIGNAYHYLSDYASALQWSKEALELGAFQIVALYLSLPSLRTARNEVGSNPVFINDYRTFHLLAESQNFHNRRS